MGIGKGAKGLSINHNANSFFEGLQKWLEKNYPDLNLKSGEIEHNSSARRKDLILGFESSYANTSYDRDVIKKIIHNEPMTIAIWSDGSKTMCKCADHDLENYDPIVGVLICIAKHAYGERFFRKEIAPFIWPREESDEPA